MVATPNAGTEIARPERLGQLLNRLTSLLQLVPSNGITDALDVILAVVKRDPRSVPSAASTGSCR